MIEKLVLWEKVLTFGSISFKPILPALKEYFIWINCSECIYTWLLLVQTFKHNKTDFRLVIVSIVVILRLFVLFCFCAAVYLECPCCFSRCVLMAFISKKWYSIRLFHPFKNAWYPVYYQVQREKCSRSGSQTSTCVRIT